MTTKERGKVENSAVSPRLCEGVSLTAERRKAMDQTIFHSQF